MKYLSLFSGIGGFELGITQAYEQLLDSTTSGRQGEDGRESVEHYPNSTNPTIKSRQQIPTCIGYSEIDKYATQIYQSHFPEHKNYGDITKINTSDLPEFELLVGGFPCQAFSIAGKRGGFNDTRGTLFFEIARILKDKRPRLLLLENVKGLLSHEEGKTFSTIISTLDELGYDIQWQVLNSKNFGVPQNRERVFIVGHLRGTSRPEVFPIVGIDRKDTEIGDHVQQRTKGIATRHLNRNGSLMSEVASTIQVAEIPHVLDTRQMTREIFPRKYDAECPTLNATMYKEPYSISDGIKIRRLTPTECERLQGFPDGWTEGVSDTQRYKTLGNAVTVNVIKEIVKRLL